MTKQVRDWQEDMKLVEAYKHAQTLHNWPYPRKLSWENNLPEPTELILEYWLQQYAAEKERADNLQEDLTDLEHRYLHLEEHSLKQKFKLEEEKQRADIAELAYRGLADDGVSRGEYESLLSKHTAMTKAYRAEKERADQAEAREKKLREALETAIPEVFTGVVRRQLKDLLALLYPKEEAK